MGGQRAAARHWQEPFGLRSRADVLTDEPLLRSGGGRDLHGPGVFGSSLQGPPRPAPEARRSHASMAVPQAWKSRTA